MPRANRRIAIPRDQVPEGACLCDYCRGNCCRYFCLPITSPRTAADFARIGWYLQHDLSLVYVHDAVWHLMIRTRCRYLGRDYRCGIYHERPEICRDYSTDDCEYVDGWAFESEFESPAALHTYAARRVPHGDLSRVWLDPELPQPEEAPNPGEILPFGAAYFVPQESPNTWQDYDAFRWFLAHGKNLVHVQCRSWYLYVLDGDQPHGPRPPGRTFYHPQQLWDFAAAMLAGRRKPRYLLKTDPEPAGEPTPTPDLVQIGPLRAG